MMEPSERSRAVIALKQANPSMTLQAIGNQCGGICRERVRQILNKANINTRNYKYLCTVCGEPIRKHGTGMCAECHHNKIYGRTNCTSCGAVIERRKALLNLHNAPFNKKRVHKYSGQYFCNKICFGKWLAAKHGFTVHPEHHGHGSGLKLSPKQITQLIADKKAGTPIKTLYRKYDISTATLYKYLKSAQTEND